jgi:competence protein ComEC
VRVPSGHVAGAAFCAGLAASLVWHPPGLTGAFVACGLASLGVALPRVRLALLVGALVVCGWWIASARLASLERSELAPFVGEAGPIMAEVTGLARIGEYDVRVPVRVLRMWRNVYDEPARLELPAGVRPPRQGARIELIATVRAPRDRDQDTGFDESAYLRRQGVHVVLRADSFREIGRRGGVPGAVDRLRDAVASSIAPGLDGERRALVAGVVLGQDEGIDVGLRDDFRASGLYHLLAVSGQNVAYVVGAVLLVAWLAGVPRLAAHLAALLAILSYVAVVGWQPSVIRAGVAGGLASLAFLYGRGRDRWYFAIVGAAVLLAWNPYGLLDPGFQLSFAAVAAIFLLVPRIERRLEGYPVPKLAAALLALSVGCGVVTAPILWLQFGAIPVLSIVANALAAPVVAPILGLGLAAAAFDPVLPSAAESLGFMNGWLAAYLAWCARTIGGLPFAQVESWAALAGLVGIPAAAVLVWRARPAVRRAVLATTGLAAAAGLLWVLLPASGGRALPPPAGLRVSFLDVGQGDAVLLQVDEGAILVDQGPPEAKVHEVLERRGVKRLAALVLTHPQRDHIGGAPLVLQELPVDLVLDPALPVANPFHHEAMAEAREHDVRVVETRAGQVFRLGLLVLRVLWPDGSAQPTDDPNHHAVVLLASYGSLDVLLTADAESIVTLRLDVSPVEVLKVAHHGSADPGLPALLGRLEPRVAVISAGSDNDYGHPTESTLAALADSPGLAVYRTDVHGTVRIEGDGTTLTVVTEA